MHLPLFSYESRNEADGQNLLLSLIFFVDLVITDPIFTYYRHPEATFTSQSPKPGLKPLIQIRLF